MKVFFTHQISQKFNDTQYLQMIRLIMQLLYKSIYIYIKLITYDLTYNLNQ